LLRSWRKTERLRVCGDLARQIIFRFRRTNFVQSDASCLA
jgi:hypothetical protein